MQNRPVEISRASLRLPRLQRSLDMLGGKVLGVLATSRGGLAFSFPACSKRLVCGFTIFVGRFSSRSVQRSIVAEVVDELERVDHGKMNLQLVANEENQDRAQCGKNEARGMISVQHKFLL